MNNAIILESLCCCGCGFDTTNVNHYCSISKLKARSLCLSKGAPEEFGSSWPCSRCANLNKQTDICNIVESPKIKKIDKRTILHSGASRIDKRSAKNNPEGTPRKRVNITSKIKSGIYYCVELLKIKSGIYYCVEFFCK